MDESGLLMAPLVRRSWAPCGQPPVLYQPGAHHRKVSAAAVLCVAPTRDQVRLYFRLYPEADIHAAQTIAFLRQLGRELGGVGVLLWDRLNAHRARRTRDFLATQPCLHPVFFPSYAPELNPVEYLWSYLKTNPLANRAHFDLPALASSARRHARQLQHRPHLLRSFLQHSPLFLRLR
ncbi:MAG: transposase [Anaerolineales bacterium]